MMMQGKKNAVIKVIDYGHLLLAAAINLTNNFQNNVPPPMMSSLGEVAVINRPASVIL